MERMYTVMISTFRVFAVVAVLAWLWAFLGFQLTGNSLMLAQGGIVVLGALLAAVMIKGSRKACLSVMGFSYVMVFSVLALSQTSLLAGGGVRMVVIDIDGQPLLQEVRLLPRKGLIETDVQSFIHVAQMEARPLAQPDDPQHVGRAAFNPTGLGDF